MTDLDNDLIEAAKNGHLEVVKYLVENGANIHADDDCALRWAVDYGHINIEQYLLDRIRITHPDSIPDIEPENISLSDLENELIKLQDLFYKYKLIAEK